MTSFYPVYQDEFGYGKGNCVAACIATIFGLELDALRGFSPYSEDMFEWTRENYPEHRYNNVDLRYNYRIVDGYPDCEGVGTGRWTYDIPETWDPPVPGLWLASINSPGLKRPVEDPYYPMPALHMVVFEDRELVHDPNPKYQYQLDSYEPKIVMQTWWSERKDG